MSYLTASLDIKEAKHGFVTYTYVVKNEGPTNAILTFNTSQRYDYFIRNDEGEKIHQFSDGKMFLQVFQDVIVKPGECLSFDLSLPKLQRGEYSIVVWLTARNAMGLRKKHSFYVE
ncbi:hypothetical protein LCL95_10205 [Bacillus timonensis]|nr:hypothetical protein [Bacillus timonensis]